MLRPIPFLALVLATLISIGPSFADTYNFSAAEGLPGSGTPDLDNESTGTMNLLSGMFIDSTGTAINYDVTGMVSSSNLYGTSGGTANSTGDNRIEYEANNDLFRFDTAWDPGEGVTGSLRTQMLFVEFDRVGLSDFATVDVGSMNTAGQAFESAALQWLDVNGNTIGTASYNGYWDVVGSTVNSDVITNSGAVWTAESTGVIDTTTDPNNPASGSSGPNNDATVSASTYLGAGVEITGYKITRWFEDVATIDDGMGGFIAGGPTTTRTGFTSRLDGGTFQAVPEPSAAGVLLFGLAGFVIRRRKN